MDLRAQIHYTGELRVENDRFDVVDKEQLAAQVVAIIDAHFTRPTADQKRLILRLAESQITASVEPPYTELQCSGGEEFPSPHPAPHAPAMSK